MPAPVPARFTGPDRTLERAATVRTIWILRARAHLAAAHLCLDDLTGELGPDQRLRHERDQVIFTRAADQLAGHLKQGGRP